MGKAAKGLEIGGLGLVGIDDPTAMPLEAIQTPDLAGQQALFNQMADIATENLWTINISTPPPQPVVAMADMKNIPKLAVYGWKTCSPANAGIETYYFGNPEVSAGAMKNKRPRHIAYPAPKFAVDEITDTAEEQARRHYRRDKIGNLEKCFADPAAEQSHGH